MIGKNALTATLALFLAGPLGACGPNNTLSLHNTGSDSRLKAVESSLQKTQEELKALERKQAQSDARLAALQKTLSGLPGQAGAAAPPVPQSSALGVGFAHPASETAGAPAAGPVPQQEPPVPEKTPETTAPAPPAGPAPTQAPRSNARPNAQTTTPAVVRPPQYSPLPPVKSPPETRHRGRVGPAETTTSTTPEAAIAADRASQATKTGHEPATPPQTAPEPTVSQPPAPQAAPQADKPAPLATAATAAPATPAANAANAAPGTASPTEKAAYNKALQLAINGHQAEAKAAFEQFMASHPQSPLMPNALYWVGEGAYQSGDYKAAQADFEKVTKDWPGHNKAADALYKLALTQEKSGDVPAARATLERYLKEYPKADLAGTVRQKLQALPK